MFRCIPAPAAVAVSDSPAATRRHQVWEIPEIRPQATEYQQPRLRCPGCGESACAALPPGAPRGQSGPRRVAFTGLRMGRFQQSKRRAAFFLQDLLQPPVFLDESPPKQANPKAWLWTAAAPLFAVFAIFSRRKAEVLPKLLGEGFRGIINCDRAKMYWLARRLPWRQAHRKRDLQALIDHRDHQVQRLGYGLMRPVKRRFQHGRRHPAQESSWTKFQDLMQPVRREVNSLALRGRRRGNPRLMGMWEALYRHRDWLWTFVDVPGIEPTHNTAERALR